MKLDIEQQKEQFKDHIATFTDYGNIKIIDFRNPNTVYYRIRFLFEEDYCKLHISGDLGELVATNYSNMTFEKFSDFVDNVGYFKEKIDCHSRKIYIYDYRQAKKDLIELIEDRECEKELLDEYYCDTIEEAIDEVLEDFSDYDGLGSKSYEKLSNIIDDFWEEAGDIGKVSTGILNLYMLAFKLAMEQIKKESAADD